MSEIGILMSIYNETLDEINRSIKSMLNQTYKDFIFAIVLDNPDREDIKEYLLDLKNKDHRILPIFNTENLGLALSLNKARERIDTKYLCRMDADDISLPQRIQIEYETITESNADLVFSQFYYIDEKGEIIGKEDNYYESEAINNLLNVINVIHHPTVLMRTKEFDKVGGYRNFPCSQDYDLWLRLSESKCKFVMIKEKLIKYTVRENSIGNSKAFMQIATLNYIKELRDMRLKTGKDNYSINNLKKYYEKNKVFDDKLKSIKVRNDLKRAKEFEENKKISKMLIIKIKIFLKYSMYRKHYIYKVKDHLRFHT